MQRGKRFLADLHGLLVQSLRFPVISLELI